MYPFFSQIARGLSPQVDPPGRDQTWSLLNCTGLGARADLRLALASPAPVAFVLRPMVSPFPLREGERRSSEWRLPLGWGVGPGGTARARLSCNRGEA